MQVPQIPLSVVAQFYGLSPGDILESHGRDRPDLMAARVVLSQILVDWYLWSVRSVETYVGPNSRDGGIAKTLYMAHAAPHYEAIERRVLRERRLWLANFQLRRAS